MGGNDACSGGSTNGGFGIHRSDDGAGDGVEGLSQQRALRAEPTGGRRKKVARGGGMGFNGRACIRGFSKAASIFAEFDAVDPYETVKEGRCGKESRMPAVSEICKGR